MDNIIQTNPKNIEIRLLRYTIQRNCPSFLLYNKDMSNDIKMIEMYFSLEDKSLQDHIKTILKSFKKDVQTAFILPSQTIQKLTINARN